MSHNDRQQKAIQLLEQKSSIKRIDGVTYKVRSQSVKHRFYFVRIDDDNNYRCECPYFSFKVKECKHIIAVKSLQSVSNEFKANLGNKRPKICKRCGAVDQCIRDGTKKQKRGIKQRY